MGFFERNVNDFIVLYGRMSVWFQKSRIFNRSKVNSVVYGYGVTRSGSLLEIELLIFFQDTGDDNDKSKS